MCFMFLILLFQPSRKLVSGSWPTMRPAESEEFSVSGLFVGDSRIDCSFEYKLKWELGIYYYRSLKTTNKVNKMWCLSHSFFQL